MTLDRIEIDWGDDGYLNPDKDVTPYLRNYTVNYGMDTVSNPYKFINRSARGQLVLDNATGKFTLNDEAESLGPTLLKQHAVRIISTLPPERVLWEGFISPSAVDNRTGAKIATFKMFGRMLTIYKERYEVDYPNQYQEFPNPYGPLVSQALDGIYDRLGSYFKFGSDFHLPHNAVFPVGDYSKDIIGFIEALSDHSCAWSLEDRCGYLAMYDQTKLGQLESIADVFADDTFILHGDSRAWPRYEMVKNILRLSQFDEISDPDSIEVYGENRQTQPEAWQTAAYRIEGEYFTDFVRQRRVMRTWFNYIGRPLPYAELTIPRDQDGRRELERIEPGVAFNLRIRGGDDIWVDSKYWCAGCTLTKQFNQPAYLKIYAADTAFPAVEGGFILGKSRLGIDRLGPRT